MLVYFLPGITLGFSAAVSPGPFQAYLIGQSLRLGARKTLPAALAPLLSDGPIIAFTLLLLSQMPPGFLQGIRLLGGLYILYLAWKAFLDFRRFAASVPMPQTNRQNLLQAVLVNFLSPGPYIFWSVLAGPLLLQGWQAQPVYGMAFLIGFYATMILCLVLLIFVFGSAGQLGATINRAMIGVSALAMLVFGVFQIWSGLSGWFA